MENELQKNETHRNQVREKISAFLFAIVNDETVVGEIVDALDAGSIPNVTINY